MAFTMKAGDTKRLHISLVDKAGSPVDLTESTLRWWASRGDLEAFSRTPVLQKALGSGIQDVAMFDGQVLVTLEPEDTADMKGSYYCELEVTDAFGAVSTPIADTFTVIKDLIR